MHTLCVNVGCRYKSAVTKLRDAQKQWHKCIADIRERFDVQLAEGVVAEIGAAVKKAAEGEIKGRTCAVDGCATSEPVQACCAASCMPLRLDVVCFLVHADQDKRQHKLEDGGNYMRLITCIQEAKALNELLSSFNAADLVLSSATMSEVKSLVASLQKQLPVLECE